MPLRRYLRFLTKITNTQFVLFSFLNFVMYFWYDVPYVFLVDKTISEGSSDSSAAFLIFIIGIVHTIGNIVCGFLGDRKWINRNVLYGLSMVFNGSSVVAMSFFTSYLPLAVLAGLFGLFSSSNETLCSIVLIDIVGLENLDKAYGFIMMLQGIANILGPPVAGQSPLRYTLNPLYNDIRYTSNSKIRYNVNSVWTKISGSGIFSLTVPCYSFGKQTF